jgi:hypothetical protein
MAGGRGIAVVIEGASFKKINLKKKIYIYTI